MAATTRTSERKRLSDALLSLGLVDKTELARAQAIMKQGQTHLLRVVVEQGWVDEDRLTRALSAALGIEAVTPATMKIHERVLGLIPARLALKHRALPVAVKRSNQVDFLYVALADPLDAEAVEELQKASGCRVQPLLAPPTQLDGSLARIYGALTDTPQSPPPIPVGRRPSVPPTTASKVLTTPIPGSPRPASVQAGLPALTPTRSTPGAPTVQRTPQRALPPLSPQRVPEAPRGALPAFPPTSPTSKTPPDSPGASPVSSRPDSPRGELFLAKPELEGMAPVLDGEDALDFSAFKPGERPASHPPSVTPIEVGTSSARPDSPRPRAESSGWNISIEEAPEAPQPETVVNRPAPVAPSKLSRESDEQSLELEEVIEDFEALGEPSSELELPRPPSRPPENGARKLDGARPAPTEPAAAGEDEDESTNQVEFDPLPLGKAPEVTSEDARADFPVPSVLPPSEFAGMLEVPVSLDHVPSPFDGIKEVQVKAGLERTGIIPAIDWGREPFEPPAPLRGDVSPLLAGVEDIPSSVASVKARLESLPSPPLVQLPQPEPEGAKRGGTAPLAVGEGNPSTPRLPTHRYPMTADLQSEPPPPRPPRLTPEELVAPTPRPLFTDLRAKEEHRLRDEDARGERPRGDDATRPGTKRPIEPEDRAMVDAVIRGETLTSAERAQMVLAVARVLLEKGIISKDELARALTQT